MLATKKAFLRRLFWRPVPTGVMFFLFILLAIHPLIGTIIGFNQTLKLLYGTNDQGKIFKLIHPFNRLYFLSSGELATYNSQTYVRGKKEMNVTESSLKCKFF